MSLSDVVVADRLSTSCGRALGTLGVNVSKDYTCIRKDVRADFENTATATGTSPSGAKVSASAHAKVTVAPFTPPERPRITIAKSPKLQTLMTRIVVTKKPDGTTRTSITYGAAHFTIRVTNTGNTILEAVRVSDASSPKCDRNLGILAPGVSETYSCTTASVKRSFTNIARVTAEDPEGVQVKASDHAVVKVTLKTMTILRPIFTG